MTKVKMIVKSGSSLLLLAMIVNNCDACTWWRECRERHHEALMMSYATSPTALTTSTNVGPVANPPVPGATTGLTNPPVPGATSGIGNPTVPGANNVTSAQDAANKKAIADAEAALKDAQDNVKIAQDAADKGKGTPDEATLNATLATAKANATKAQTALDAAKAAASPGTGSNVGVGSAPQGPPPTADMRNLANSGQLQAIDAKYDALNSKISKIRLVENHRHIMKLLLLPQEQRADYVKQHNLESFLSGE